MKKLLSIMLAACVCLSLCGCASMQARMADSMEDFYGIEGKTYEEHKEMYQAEWDAFYAELKKLLGITTEATKETVKDAVDDAVENAVDKVLSNDTVDWENITAQAKLTLANIKDENGFTECYDNSYSKGQCTWYAYGRMKERTGIELNVSGNAKQWIDTCTNDDIIVERDLTKIQSNCVAVFHKPTDPSHWGHVVYVEHVTHDENGNPDTVYFTECNMDAYTLSDGSKNPKWGVYNEGDDCIVKTAKYEDFIARSNGAHQALGYLIPND